jgi:hypothetical protein
MGCRHVVSDWSFDPPRVARSGHAGGDRRGGVACLGERNKFVKFRLTTVRHTGSEAEARGFVAAWSDILWPSI